MARRTDEPTMTAWWTRESEAEADDSTMYERPSFPMESRRTTRPVEAPFAGLESVGEYAIADDHARATTPAPESMETLAAASAIEALKAPRTPIEMWDLASEEPAPSSEWPTRIAASPEQADDDPHAAPDSTVILPSPASSMAVPRASHVAPLAVIRPHAAGLGAPRPRTILPPPAPHPHRPPMITAPTARRTMTTPPPPAAWRARALVACIGGMAFGAALLAAFFHAHAQATAEPAPLFAVSAAPIVAPPPASTTNAAEIPVVVAPPPVAIALAAAPEPAPAPKPKPAAPPAASHASSGAQVSFAVTAPAPEKKKTAKDKEIDAMLEKLGEEQLAR